jgi:mono/diheme cytochrome c family protein
MSVPNDGAPYTTNETITFSVTGSWSFPTGTVFVKHFELPMDDTNPALRKRLETRFLIHGTNGMYFGLTYKWRSDGSDADLLAGGLSETNLITTATGVRTQVWYYPSRQDCVICHNVNAKQVLGPRTCQMNGDFTYPATGQPDNQIRTLNHIGMFNTNLDESSIPAFPRSAPLDDSSASPELRVRSYLDANCSQCHRPGGAAAFFDARLETPLAQQGLIEGPVAATLGIPGAKVVSPQSPGLSMLFVRDSLVGQNQMPPLAKNMVDAGYTNLLAQWINSLPLDVIVGNTNDGTVTDPMGASWINAARFQAGANLTLTALFAKVTAIAGNYKCAVYSDNGAVPDRLLRDTLEVSSPATDGWQTFPLTSSLALTNGLYYWLAIWSDDPDAEVFYSGGGSLRFAQYPYGAWPDLISTMGAGGIGYCLYATGVGAAFVAPLILSINLENDLVTIVSSAAQGRSYELQFTSAIGDTNWVSLPPSVVATGATVTLTNAPSGSNRFYRVRQTEL